MVEKVLTVGLVYGGKSGEHEVSLQTAFAVMNAFDFSQYKMIPFYITKQGEWRKGEELHAPFAEVGELKLESICGGTKAAMDSLFSRLYGDLGGPDIMFPLLHGTFGEDGTIQGLFEMADMPYVGAGVLASAAGMDKGVMKKLFAQAGLPQVAYCYFNQVQWNNERHILIQEMEDELGYPCFVKPANLGSSVGISKARHREELEQAVEYALRYDLKVIVEEFVDAREIELGVLGNEEPAASVPGEIVSSAEYYDYAAKYTDGQSELLIPAPLAAEQVEQLREAAVRAYRAIEGCGIARVDFFLRKSDESILINEINTMPGFTPYSMYPLLWRETGLFYGELLEQMIRLGLERYERRAKLQYENM